MASYDGIVLTAEGISYGDHVPLGAAVASGTPAETALLWVDVFGVTSGGGSLEQALTLYGGEQVPCYVHDDPLITNFVVEGALSGGHDLLWNGFASLVLGDLPADAYLVVTQPGGAISLSSIAIIVRLFHGLTPFASEASGTFDSGFFGGPFSPDTFSLSSTRPFVMLAGISPGPQVDFSIGAPTLCGCTPHEAGGCAGTVMTVPGVDPPADYNSNPAGSLGGLDAVFFDFPSAGGLPDQVFCDVVPYGSGTYTVPWSFPDTGFVQFCRPIAGPPTCPFCGVDNFIENYHRQYNDGDGTAKYVGLLAGAGQACSAATGNPIIEHVFRASAGGGDAADPFPHPGVHAEGVRFRAGASA